MDQLLSTVQGVCIYQAYSIIVYCTIVCYTNKPQNIKFNLWIQLIENISKEKADDDDNNAAKPRT